uniref:Transcription factor domain-containing protein n=1 Tax=Talaromyces marneffei PM1 TaxID=1077442 RepID=A0A093VPZ1_TALMA
MLNKYPSNEQLTNTDVPETRKMSDKFKDFKFIERRRRVRKGTHSCWESRGSSCTSQEFIDDTQPKPRSDGIVQRLEKLETLIGKLVEPESFRKNNTSTRMSWYGILPTISTPTKDDFDEPLNIETPVADDAPIGFLLNLQQMSGLVQSDQNVLNSKPSVAKQTFETNTDPWYGDLSRTLFTLFPSQEMVDSIVKFSTGGHYLASRLYSSCDIALGQTELLPALREIPPATSHPAVLAKRLLQLSICIQQLKSGFDDENTKSQARPVQVMDSIINAVMNNVTSNDSLVCNYEGLECLIIQGFWLENAGNLRKAWLTYRKAMNVGLLMGIDQTNCNAEKIAEHSSTPDKRIPLETMWFRIVSCDRFLSLLLGLPAGSMDNSFASHEIMGRLTAMERLERLQAVASARIIERNRNKSSHDYVSTQAIDIYLEDAAGNMQTDWWLETEAFNSEDRAIMGRQIMQISLQINHYSLLVLLHLPYMLRDPAENRYQYSKAICINSSREVLQRFIGLRKLVNSPFTCRHVDYAALFAAMTLLLSYLKQHANTDIPQTMPPFNRRQADRRLVEVVCSRMQELASTTHDKVSKESAATIRHMMPILDSIDSSLVKRPNKTEYEPVCLTIPYVGSVRFYPSTVNRFHVQPPIAADRPEVPIQFASITPTMDSLDDSIIDGMFMELEPNNDSVSWFPDMAAEVENWGLQGVESTYWSLLQDDMFSTKR